MKFKKMETHKKILIAFMLFGFAAIALYLFVGYPFWIQSDTSNACILAREQIASHSIYPKDFIYMQEIQFIYLNLPIAILSLFSNNQMLIHSIACIIFLSVGICSVVVLHEKGLKSAGWIISVSLIFGGMSSHTTDSWADMLYSQTAYLPILFNLFFALTLFLTSVDIGDHFKIKNGVMFLGFNLYIIVMGMTGPRYLQIMVLPLLCAICLYYYMENAKSDVGQIKKSIKSPLLLVSVISFFAFLGVIVFIGLSKYVLFTSGVVGAQTFVRSPAEIASNLSGLVQTLVFNFGYRPDVALISVGGAINAVKIVAALMFSIVLPFLMVRRYAAQTAEMKFFILFTLGETGVFLLMAVFVRHVMPTGRYLIPTLMLLIVLSSIYMSKYWLARVDLTQFVVVAGLCIVLMSSYYLILEPLSRVDKQKENKYSIINFLDKNDLKFGYATYWNANANMVLSDFEIQINAINYNENGDISPFNAFVSKYRYEPGYYIGPTFLMLTEQENELISREKIDAALGVADDVLTCSGYTIYVYNYNIAEKLWE